MKQIQIKQAKILLFVVLGLVVASWVFINPYGEKYNFQNITYDQPSRFRSTTVIFSIEHETSCLNLFLSIFHNHKISLLLFDTDILSELVQPHFISWNNSNHSNKTLENLHFQDKNFITFAIKALAFESKKDAILHELKTSRYVVHLSNIVDQRFSVNNHIQLISTRLWVAKNNFLIQVTVLHERSGNYWWTGPVESGDWEVVSETLAPAFSEGKLGMEEMKTSFSTYAQAFDKLQSFFTSFLNISGYIVSIPDDVTAFLEEHKNSEFIECDYKRAKEYKKKYEKSLTSKDEDFKTKAKDLILKAKSAFDKLGVPFSLSSGSCLGWFRQCDIIPYTIDVDFDILIHNYNERIIDGMRNAGLRQLYKFGKLNDSLEYSFIGKDHIKLDIFFIYEEKDHFWFGGVRGYDGQKYKYKLPKFKLCWTEFLNVKIRVPCNPEKYIEANYGKNWGVPKKDWVWNKSPPNLEIIGKWSKSEMKEVVQVF